MAPLSSEYGTCKTAKARFWPCLPGEDPQSLFEIFPVRSEAASTIMSLPCSDHPRPGPVRTGFLTGPPRGERAPRVRISSTVFTCGTASEGRRAARQCSRMFENTRACWSPLFTCEGGGVCTRKIDSSLKLFELSIFVVKATTHTRHSRELSGRGAARAEDAQGTPTQSHISPSILLYEEQCRLHTGCSSLLDWRSTKSCA